jgi:hypothetical protein
MPAEGSNSETGEIRPWDVKTNLQKVLNYNGPVTLCFFSTFIKVRAYDDRGSPCGGPAEKTRRTAAGRRRLAPAVESS